MVKAKRTITVTKFPLYKHTAGYWAKKVRGKTIYFTKLKDDPKGEAALNQWLDERDDLLAGRTPYSGEGLTVIDLVNLFLERKEQLVTNGEIVGSTFDDHKENCKRVVSVLGRKTLLTSLQPVDFGKLRASFSKTHGLKTLEGDIACTRALFNFARKNFDITVKFGDQFDKPSKAAMRRYKSKRNRRFFEASEIRHILDVLNGKEVTLQKLNTETGKTQKVRVSLKHPQLRAMALLGINIGFGNDDCAELTFEHLDLARKWINFPRPKTDIARRCPLWSETVAALKEAIENRKAIRTAIELHRAKEARRAKNKGEVYRPEPLPNHDKVFVTKFFQPWTPKSTKDSPVSTEFTKLLKILKLHKPGVSFYALRHTFLSVGKRATDKEAVEALMGHVEDSTDMHQHYDEIPVEDERLIAVVNHVRKWLTDTAS